MQRNFYVKSHGLGNEYVVIDTETTSINHLHLFVTRLCDIHYGLGTDGVLLKVPSSKADFGLRIFNPDGSEAEKSGNGLRIFCKYLFDHGHTRSTSFTVETPGGIVDARVLETSGTRAQVISIDMGHAVFEPARIPVLVHDNEVIKYPLQVGDKTFSICCVSVGNPHCVILVDTLDESMVRLYGSLIENHPLFPNRINVQFASIQNRGEVMVQVWERGAGYTLASGSSSCAVASVTRKLGLVDPDVKIVMPGGSLDITVDNQWNIRMSGPVREIATGFLSDEFMEDAGQ